MSRLTRHHKQESPPELNITTFLNLMVVLIPFLLATAVFSRITILEMDLPTAAGGVTNKPAVTIEVMVRKNRLEIGNGRKITTTIANVDGKYNLSKLSDALLAIKKANPDKEDATILVEPNIEYEHVVHVMDAVKVRETKQPGSDLTQKSALFPAISIGDTP
jgi:biopolymer transport protein ExbD